MYRITKENRSKPYHVRKDGKHISYYNNLSEVWKDYPDAVFNPKGPKLSESLFGTDPLFSKPVKASKNVKDFTFYAMVRSARESLDAARAGMVAKTSVQHVANPDSAQEIAATYTAERLAIMFHKPSRFERLRNFLGL